MNLFVIAGSAGLAVLLDAQRRQMRVVGTKSGLESEHSPSRDESGEEEMLLNTKLR
jgi:hypothetical protein